MRTTRLNENDLARIVRRVLREEDAMGGGAPKKDCFSDSTIRLPKSCKVTTTGSSIGGQVFVDKRVLLKHTGTYVFDYQTQDKLYADLHEIAVANQANQPQIVMQQQPVAAELDAPATPVEATVIATNKKVEDTTATAE